jgi:hypothetical protein
MSNKMEIDAAMAQLEAGKFSFQMVDAIKDHVARLEKETDVLRACNSDALSEMKRQEYAIWRLETEACRLNAKIYALLKVNAISELVCRESAVAAVKLREFLDVSAKAAQKALERGVADIKAGKPQAELTRVSGAIIALVRENAPTEQQIREAIVQIEPHLEELKKRIGPAVDKMTAYLSNLKKTFA